MIRRRNLNVHIFLDPAFVIISVRQILFLEILIFCISILLLIVLEDDATGLYTKNTWETRGYRKIEHFILSSNEQEINYSGKNVLRKKIIYYIVVKIRLLWVMFGTVFLRYYKSGAGSWKRAGRKVTFTFIPEEAYYSSGRNIPPSPVYVVLSLTYFSFECPLTRSSVLRLHSLYDYCVA